MISLWSGEMIQTTHNVKRADRLISSWKMESCNNYRRLFFCKYFSYFLYWQFKIWYLLLCKIHSVQFICISVCVCVCVHSRGSYQLLWMLGTKNPTLVPPIIISQVQPNILLRSILNLVVGMHLKIIYDFHFFKRSFELFLWINCSKFVDDGHQ